MTTAEAIERLKAHLRDVSDDEYEEGSDTDLHIEALQIAIAALEKQAPKPAAVAACTKDTHSHCRECGWCEITGSCICYAR